MEVIFTLYLALVRSLFTVLCPVWDCPGEDSDIQTAVKTVQAVTVFSYYKMIAGTQDIGGEIEKGGYVRKRRLRGDVIAVYTSQVGECNEYGSRQVRSKDHRWQQRKLQ